MNITKLAITGESGSGKTTLLNVLGCITEVTIGTYILNNQKVNFLNHKLIQSIKNQMIGFVVQDFNLLNDINVYDNVELPLLFNPNISFEVMPYMIDIALKKVGMYQMKNEIVEYLSGGQKQRVAIARAIVMKPDIILADEPTGALDVNTTNSIINLFGEINKTGTTIVLATHNSVLSKSCDREIILSDGRIIN